MSSSFSSSSTNDELKLLRSLYFNVLILLASKNCELVVDPRVEKAFELELELMMIMTIKMISLRNRIKIPIMRGMIA